MCATARIPQCRSVRVGACVRACACPVRARGRSSLFEKKIVAQEPRPHKGAVTHTRPRNTHAHTLPQRSYIYTKRNGDARESGGLTWDVRALVTRARIMRSDGKWERGHARPPLGAATASSSPTTGTRQRSASAAASRTPVEGDESRAVKRGIARAAATATLLAAFAPILRRAAEASSCTSTDGDRSSATRGGMPQADAIVTSLPSLALRTRSAPTANDCTSTDGDRSSATRDSAVTLPCGS